MAESSLPLPAGAADSSTETGNAASPSEQLTSPNLSSQGGGPSSDESADPASKPFIPKQPTRDEMVRQAVSFLSHPKVKGSPIKFRRAFLEKKGLNADEIDKAFQLVPDDATGDESTDTASASGYVTSQAGKRAAAASAAQQPTATAGVPQAQAQGQLQGPVPPQGPAYNQAPVPSQPGYGAPVMPPQQALAPAQQPRTVTWMHVVGGLAALGALGAGSAVLAKRYALPALKWWLLEDAKRKTEKLKQEEEKGQEGSSKAVEGEGEMSALMREMRAMAAELKSTQQQQQQQQGGITSADLRKEIMSCMSVMNEFRQGGTLSAPAPAPAQAPLLSADAERAQRLERELEDLKRLLRSRPGAGEVGSGTGVTGAPVLPQTSPMPHAFQDPRVGGGGGLSLSSSSSSLVGQQTPAAEGAYDAPMSKSYMEILEMVKRGETPPGIRDINDKPPNPNQAPSASHIAPRPKPWEQQQQQQIQAGTRSGSLPHGRTTTSLPQNSSSLPPWLRAPSNSTSATLAPSQPSVQQQQQQQQHGQLGSQYLSYSQPGQQMYSTPVQASPNNSYSMSTAPSGAYPGATAPAMYQSGSATAQQGYPNQASMPMSEVLSTGSVPSASVSSNGQQQGYQESTGTSLFGAASTAPTASPAASSWVPPSVPKPALAEAATAIRKFPSMNQTPWAMASRANGAPGSSASPSAGQETGAASGQAQLASGALEQGAGASGPAGLSVGDPAAGVSGAGFPGTGGGMPPEAPVAANQPADFGYSPAPGSMPAAVPFSGPRNTSYSDVLKGSSPTPGFPGEGGGEGGVSGQLSGGEMRAQSAGGVFEGTAGLEGGVGSGSALGKEGKAASVN